MTFQLSYLRDFYRSNHRYSPSPSLFLCSSFLCRSFSYFFFHLDFFLSTAMKFRRPSASKQLYRIRFSYSSLSNLLTRVQFDTRFIFAVYGFTIILYSSQWLFHDIIGCILSYRILVFVVIHTQFCRSSITHPLKVQNYCYCYYSLVFLHASSANRRGNSFLLP